MANIESGGPGSIKTDGLTPTIAFTAMNARGLDVKYLFRFGRKRCRKYHERIETIKAEAMEAGTGGELTGGGESLASSAAQSAIKGNFVGVADTSGSMTWEGKSGNRPIDIVAGLTAFMSEVSAPEYRNIAFQFQPFATDFQFREECWRNQCANDCC